MALLTIGGTAIPDSEIEYSVRLIDIDSDNTVRSESGILQRERIRAGVYKIEVKFRVTKAALKVITDLVAPKSFSCTFFDPTTSSEPTKTMYAGDRVGTLVLSTDGLIANSEWDLAMSIIEY